MNRLLVLNAHGLDLVTLLAAASDVGISGESNPVARGLYGVAGPLGLIALKAVGASLLAVIVGRSQLRLALAVLAGLAGAMVNVIAWRVFA